MILLSLNMKLTILILSVCICMAFANSALAQDDYIITLKNDTLKGKITKPLFGRYRFKEAGQAKEVTINLKNTKVYHKGKESETFAARNLPGASKPSFLQVREQGYIHLYELVQSTQGQFGNTTVTSWYASKGEGPLLSIKTNGLSFSRAEKENNFEKLLGDNSELWGKFKTEKSFSFNMLRDYIKLYNQQKQHENTSTK
jgi:hypothetical protein